MSASMLAFAVGMAFINYPHKLIAKYMSWYCLTILCISTFMIILGFNFSTYELLIAAVFLAVTSWFAALSILLVGDCATDS